MENKNTNKNMNGVHSERYRKDAPSATSGINTPGVELPAFNPPVPNRAWTAMKKGIEELSAEEKRDLYFGKRQ